MTDTPPDNKGDWREQRRAERRERRHAMDNGWAGIPIGGAIVVLVGLLFLARNFGFDLPLPHRWWAIFILIPAAGALVTAVRFSRIDGATSRVIGAATGGVLMLAVALILFLDLDWGRFWPVLVIIAGLGIVVRGYGRRG